jgi:Fe2+ transport system protein B
MRARKSRLMDDFEQRIEARKAESRDFTKKIGKIWVQLVLGIVILWFAIFVIALLAGSFDGYFK